VVCSIRRSSYVVLPTAWGGKGERSGVCDAGVGTIDVYTDECVESGVRVDIGVCIVNGEVASSKPNPLNVGPPSPCILSTSSASVCTPTEHIPLPTVVSGDGKDPSPSGETDGLKLGVKVNLFLLGCCCCCCWLSTLDVAELVLVSLVCSRASSITFGHPPVDFCLRTRGLIGVPSSMAVRR
jgi:hypothetical protein